MRAGTARPGLFLGSAVLARALVLWAMGSGISFAQSSVTITGDVVNGTQGAEPLAAELPVLLLVTDRDGNLAATGQTTTDAAGRFRFDQVDLLEGATYTVGVEYAGVLYRTTLAATDLGQDLNITVYETTEDVSVVSVTRQVMVLANVDKDGRQVTVTELVRLVNRSDRTLLPAPLGSGRMSFLRFSLPSESSELIVQSDLPPGEIISVGTGFALTSPVAPGEHAVEFSYLFPYNGDRVSFSQNLLQGAEIYQVLVPERLPTVQVTGLEPIPVVNIQGSVYRAWEGRDFLPGEGPEIELVHLPQPGLLARLKNSLTNGALWRKAIPAAAAASLALLLLFGAIKAPRGTAAQEGQAPRGPLPDVSSELVQAIARLDEQYRRGELAEDQYRRTRQGLKSRVLAPYQAIQPEAKGSAAAGGPGGC